MKKLFLTVSIISGLVFSGPLLAHTQKLSEDQVIQIGTKCIAFGIDENFISSELVLNSIYDNVDGWLDKMDELIIEGMESETDHRPNTDCLTDIWIAARFGHSLL